MPAAAFAAPPTADRGQGMTVNISTVSVSPVSFLRSRPTHAIALVILGIHVTVVRCRIAMRSAAAVDGRRRAIRSRPRAPPRLNAQSEGDEPMRNCMVYNVTSSVRTTSAESLSTPLPPPAAKFYSTLRPPKSTLCSGGNESHCARRVSDLCSEVMI